MYSTSRDPRANLPAKAHALALAGRDAKPPKKKFNSLRLCELCVRQNMYAYSCFIALQCFNHDVAVPDFTAVILEIDMALLGNPIARGILPLTSLF